SKWCFVEVGQARAVGKIVLPIKCAPIDRKVIPHIHAVNLLDLNSGGLDQLEKSLRAISNDLARGFTLDPARVPFPGIHSFEYQDAAIYFGRDQEAFSVIERLDSRRTQGGARFLVVIGRSGSGKSSLLKAGVLPQLARRPADWNLLPPMRPERGPLETLAKALAQHLGKPDTWREAHDKLKGNEPVAFLEEVARTVRVGRALAATL